MALDPGFTVAGSLAILFLIGASAFFSSSEIAIFSLASHRVDALSATGAAGRTLARLREDPHKLLVTVLVGNNVANIAAASIATALFVQVLPAGQAVSAATVFTSGFVLVVGEIAPKSYAVSNAEPWSLRVVRPLAAIQKLMSPVVYLFEIATGAVTRLIGGSTNFETYLTREDIETIVVSGAETGAIATEEGAMIRGVLDLGETTVRSVMVPRVDMVAVPRSADLDTVVETAADRHITRMPVFGENRDDVVGVVDLRDALTAREAGGDLSEALSEPVFVPESKPIDELLAEMQAENLRMVLVVDEFGSVVGLAALEDVIEEVVGEILDHGETEPVRILEETTAVAHGWTTVAYVNEVLGLSLPTDAEFETLAGLIHAHTGRLPEEGDRITVAGVTLTVMDATKTRIRRVRLEWDGDE
jgi:CBS domain containing-hemolysin-like protein